MQAVNAEILAQLNSEVLLINQLGHYIIAGGGKRIRPLIAVLAARALVIVVKAYHGGCFY